MREIEHQRARIREVESGSVGRFAQASDEIRFEGANRQWPDPAASPAICVWTPCIRVTLRRPRAFNLWQSVPTCRNKRTHAITKSS
jgi:hypothetical protein